MYRYLPDHDPARRDAEEAEYATIGEKSDGIDAT